MASGDHRAPAVADQTNVGELLARCQRADHGGEIVDELLLGKSLIVTGRARDAALVVSHHGDSPPRELVGQNCESAMAIPLCVTRARPRAVHKDREVRAGNAGWKQQRRTQHHARRARNRQRLVHVWKRRLGRLRWTPPGKLRDGRQRHVQQWLVLLPFGVEAVVDPCQPQCSHRQVELGGAPCFPQPRQRYVGSALIGARDAGPRRAVRASEGFDTHLQARSVDDLQAAQPVSRVIRQHAGLSDGGRRQEHGHGNHGSSQWCHVGLPRERWRRTRHAAWARHGRIVGGRIPVDTADATDGAIDRRVGKSASAVPDQNAWLMPRTPDPDVRLRVSGLSWASPSKLLAESTAVTDVRWLIEYVIATLARASRAPEPAE